MCVNLHALGETFGVLPSDLLKRDMVDLMIDSEVLRRSQSYHEKRRDDQQSARERFDPKEFASRVRELRAKREAAASG